LSCGVCLQNPPKIAELEFINSLEKHLFGDDTSRDAYAYWTKIGFPFGELFPHTETEILAAEQVNLIQKVFLDFLWETSFADIVSFIGDSRPSLDYFVTWASQANLARKNEPRVAFQKARTEAMAALLTTAIPRLEHVFRYLHERFNRSGRRLEDVPMPEPDPAFIPSLQIVGNLFAVMRSSGRAYDANDYSDFEHGSLALPYCDAFFCDRRFFNILTEKPLELHRLYGAYISFKPEDLLVYLEKLKIE
jgi:hypothetical protein